MKVIVVFIRHGFSCANTIEKFGSISDQYKRLLYLDPPLTNYAINNMRSMKKKYNKVKFDYILSSTMVRAEETALSLFPDREILVVPFVKEESLGLDNTIIDSPMEQLQFINKKLKSKKLNYYYSVGENDTWTDDAHESDYEKFKNIILVDIVKNTKFKRRERPIVIALVTHSIFMQKIFNTKNKPQNVASGIKVFDYINGTLVEKKQIPAIGSEFDQNDGIKPNNILNKDDISNCEIMLN